MTLNEITLVKKQFQQMGLQNLAPLDLAKYFEILGQLEEPELLDQFLENQGIDINEFSFQQNAQTAKKIFQLMMQEINFPAQLQSPKAQTAFLLNGQAYKTAWDGEEVDYIFLGPINAALKKEGISYRWYFAEPLVLSESMLQSEEPKYCWRLVYLEQAILEKLEAFLPYSEIEHYCHL